MNTLVLSRFTFDGHGFNIAGQRFATLAKSMQMPLDTAGPEGWREVASDDIYSTGLEIAARIAAFGPLLDALEMLDCKGELDDKASEEDEVRAAKTVLRHFLETFNHG